MPKCTLRQLKSHTFHVQSSDKSSKFIVSSQIWYFYVKLHYNEYPKFSIHGEIRKSLIIFIWLKKLEPSCFIYSLLRTFGLCLLRISISIRFWCRRDTHQLSNDSQFQRHCCILWKETVHKVACETKGVIQHKKSKMVPYQLQKKEAKN